METITIEIKSLHRMHLELNVFPELSARNRLVQKGLVLIKKHLPAVLRYLSKQKVLANLKKYRIEIHGGQNVSLEQARHLLRHWIRRRKINRIFFLIIEILLMPLGVIFGLLPGPNLAFYSLFVLFYFHLQSFLSLRKINPDDLQIEIIAPGEIR